jgi:hypothetical protein
VDITHVERGPGGCSGRLAGDRGDQRLLEETRAAVGARNRHPGREPDLETRTMNDECETRLLWLLCGVAGIGALRLCCYTAVAERVLTAECLHNV